mgnify:CR=1 FL=1
MTKRTLYRGHGLQVIIGSILGVFGLFLSYFSYASDFSLREKTELDNVSTGVIKDIETIGDTIYIASENGVFEFVGGTASKLNYKSSSASSGLISDIHYDPDGFLWIVEYSVGVFRLDLNSHISEQVFTEVTEASDSWAIEMSEDHVILSVINGILLFQKETLSQVDWLSDLGPGKLLNVYSLALTINGAFLVSSHNRFLSITPNEQNVEVYSIEEHFPELNYVTSVFSIDEDNFFAGDTGMYTWSLENSTPNFIDYSHDLTITAPIEDIHKTANGELWVAAGGVYRLTEHKITSMPFMNPVLTSDDIKNVAVIDSISSGEVLIASSQLGLIAITEGHKSVNLMHHKNELFTKNITDFGLISEGNAIVATTQGLFSLMSDFGQISTVEEDNYNSSCVTKESLLFELLSSENGITNEYCSRNNSHIVKVSDKQFYAYFDDVEAAGYYLVSEKKIIDLIPAPKNIVNTLLLSSGELVAYDEFDVIHIQLSRVKWKSIGQDEEGWQGITCIFEYSGHLFLCTTGSGLRGLALDNQQLVDTNQFNLKHLKFIRGALVSAKGNVWISTNSGLFVYDSENDITFDVADRVGVVDRDFEYGGIFKIDSHIVILGDKYTYLINEKRMLTALNTEFRRKSHMQFKMFSWLDSDDISTQFFSDIQGHAFDIKGYIKNLTVSMSSTSLLNNNDHLLQYRLLGHDDAWKTHPESHATLLFSDLGFGQYELQTRVASDDNSQPISSVLFYISPPFYLSTIAWLIYLLFVITVIFAYKRSYFQTLVLRMHEHPFYRWVTRYELTDGQSKFEKMLRSRERHIRDLVHEMRTPVQMMLGALESSKSDKASISEAWVSLDQNARRLQQLVAQMNATGPSIEDKSLLYKNYSLNDLKQIITSLEPLAHQKRQTIDVKIRGNQTVSLITDSLEKIVSNLVENAVKYSPAHSAIVVSASCDDKALKISVSDNGEGIAPESHDIIFERFERAHAGDEEGAGIGLSLVKSLVKLNQGNISVESAPGNGAKFVVKLPVDDVTFINEIETAEEALQKWAERKTLLIVDDNRQFRSYLFSLLTNKYRCLVASNGKQALTLLNTYTIDLVISDLMMSPMDGLSFTDEVRKLNENMPIVVLTACSDEREKRKAFSKKVDCFLTKPVSNEEFLLRIAHQLSLRDSLSEAPNENEISHTPKSLIIPELVLEKDMSFYLNFISVLESHYKDESFNRDKAAKAMLISSRSLNRKLSELFEYNFSEFLTRFRVDKATPQLLSGATVTDACLDVGFGTASYFSTTFKRIKGVSPKKFVEQHQRNAAA